MIVVLSGEGPTDLGQCGNAQNICEDGNFQIGPMTVLLDQMLESRLDYSLRSISGGYQYVSETALANKRKEVRQNNSRKVSLVGKKRSQETGHFYINAWMLADIAVQVEKEREDKVVAVLFRDCDGTRSSRAGLWSSKWESMNNGFDRASFSRGVSMLSNPKSEAWLLCAAQPLVVDCSCFEWISGNDASPNSAKSQLNGVFGVHKSADELCKWLDENPIDEDRLSSMPSFMAFKESLETAIAAVISSREGVPNFV